MQDSATGFKVGRVNRYYLLGAVLLGLLVRIPGVFWGYNFPTGWYGHHIDEYSHLINAETLINPKEPPRWRHPYPKGLGAHVAVPMIALRAIEGKLFEKPPPVSAIIVTGRVFSIIYGAATILIVFLLARRLFRDQRVAHVAAWIFALGGLHVSQSHFFVADVPSLFWFLLGTYLLFLDLDNRDKNSLNYLIGAAFSFGVAFGTKLVVFGLPSMAFVAVMRSPRFLRSLQAAAFFLAGFVVVNLAFYTPLELAKTLLRGTGDPWQFSSLWNLLLYLIELPSIISFPVILLAVGAVIFLVPRLFSPQARDHILAITLVIFVPLLINILFIIFKLDHFPRHIIPLIPWISMLAAWSMVKIMNKVKSRRIHPSVVMIPLFLYLVFFIYDGEKVFLNEPRNKAARWLLENVAPGTGISWVYHGWIPKYKHIYFPQEGRPPVVVMEMHHANHFLSGLGWKNSYPRDYRRIFDSGSQETVDSIQSLFKGESEYREAARFSEGYFMPEYLLVDRVLGNRSRNYIAEIVIFSKAEHQKSIKLRLPESTS
jgi:hypothetical protein